MNCRVLKISTLAEWKSNSQWLKKRNVSDPAIEKSVRDIIENVSTKGDKALIDYTRQFDCDNFEPPLRVSADEIAMSAASVPLENREQICAAAINIRKFHEVQRERSWFITQENGSILGQRVIPIDSAGLYVPGGKGGSTPLVSSLLMNAIPAQVAGCPRIVVVTPPQTNGKINPCLLAAAHLLDIDEVYRVGGAWTIAALALGTESIAPVDIIAGPGNIYVSTAKRILHGITGIDMIAGPSELLVIADQNASPVWVAADMLSQAEHDELASVICLTTDRTLLDNVFIELKRQLLTLPRAHIAEKSLDDWGCICHIPNIETALEIANAIAPEHLELCVSDPWSLIPSIKHAGAIFMGHNSPEAIGDYFAGPNHILPTMGTARFSSAVSVQTFSKRSSIIAASPNFIKQSSPAVAALARLEGLEAHARSIEFRTCHK